MMEYSHGFTAVALAACVGKTVISYGCRRWDRYWLRKKYIQQAAVEQYDHETVEEVHAEALDLLLGSDPEHTQVDVVKAATRHRGSFRNYLVRSAQAKFGCPLRNEANRLTVRKFIYDLCVEHKLLARHICDHIDIATELVFIPSRNQLLACAVRHTDLSILREGVHRELTGVRPSIA